MPNSFVSFDVPMPQLLDETKNVLPREREFIWRQQRPGVGIWRLLQNYASETSMSLYLQGGSTHRPDKIVLSMICYNCCSFTGWSKLLPPNDISYPPVRCVPCFSEIAVFGAHSSNGFTPSAVPNISLGVNGLLSVRVSCRDQLVCWCMVLSRGYSA